MTAWASHSNSYREMVLDTADRLIETFTHRYLYERLDSAAVRYTYFPKVA